MSDESTISSSYQKMISIRTFIYDRTNHDQSDTAFYFGSWDRRIIWDRKLSHQTRKS